VGDTDSRHCEAGQVRTERHPVFAIDREVDDFPVPVIDLRLVGRLVDADELPGGVEAGVVEVGPKRERRAEIRLPGKPSA
jgi:hypothetical protein